MRRLHGSAHEHKDKGGPRMDTRTAFQNSRLANGRPARSSAESGRGPAGLPNEFNELVSFVDGALAALKAQSESKRVGDDEAGSARIGRPCIIGRIQRTGETVDPTSSSPTR